MRPCRAIASAVLALALVIGAAAAQDSRPDLAGKWCGVVHDGSWAQVARPPARYRFFELDLVSAGAGSGLEGSVRFRDDGRSVPVVATIRRGMWEIDFRDGLGDLHRFIREDLRRPDGELVGTSAGELADGLANCRMIELHPGRVVFANEGHLTSYVVFRCRLGEKEVEEYPTVFGEGTLFAVPDRGPCTWTLHDDGLLGRRQVEELRVEAGPRIVYWGSPKEPVPAASRGAVRSDPPRGASLPEIERTLTAALEWLRRHQSPDGSWDAGAFAARCDASLGAKCTGGGDSGFDAGATALALLAFLGAGYDTVRPSRYLDTVRNGLKHLRSIQDAEGCFGSRENPRHLLSHACATFAMCEAWSSTRQIPWRKSAERAIAYAVASQTPYRGWRGGALGAEDDELATGWTLLALDSARERFPVSARVARDGLAFLDSASPARKTARVLDLGVSLLWEGLDSPSFREVADDLRESPPSADESRGPIDLTRWYFGSLALFELGGARWAEWYPRLCEAAMRLQLRDGCVAGSWDPKGSFGEEAGRVGATALVALCLEVHWREPRLFTSRRSRGLRAESSASQPAPK